MDKEKAHPSPSRNLTLPPIGKGRSGISPSSIKPLTDHSTRTIETEFGTIIVDGKTLTVHSEKVNAPVAPPSTAMLLEPGNAQPKESVLATAPPENLELLLAIENSRRMESGNLWMSECEGMALAMSSFMAFRCAIRGPRLWLQFNGGAFVVAFAVCQAVLSLPLLLLEATLGQFAGHGMAGYMPQMAPALRGYPNALLFCLVVKVIFWMDNLSTVGIYVVEALEFRPCWMNCNESFHSDGCYTPVLDETCQSRGALLFAVDRCVDRSELCQPSNVTKYLSPTLHRLSEACVHLENGSTWINGSVVRRARELAAAEYFYDVQRAGGGRERVHAHGRGVLSLLFCWLLLALVCQAGFEYIGYTLPLLLGLPAGIACAIIVHELLLLRDFSILGRQLLPSIEHLSDYKCWLFAATSSLLSLNIGTGCNSLIYARNPPNHDCQRSVIVLVVVNFAVNTLWSLGCTVMMARNAARMGKSLLDLLQDYGTEPDLIMLTIALGQSDGTQVWLGLLLLFTMLLALGTAQVAVLVLEASLRELCVIGAALSTRAAVCLICSAGFILDVLVYLFSSGPDLNAAVGAYANSYFNIVLTLLLVCAVNATLGVERLLGALGRQLAVPPRRLLSGYWTLCWRGLCPLLLLGMFVSNVWHHATHPLMFRDVQLSSWTAVVAVVLAVAPLLLLLVDVFRVYAEVGSGDAEELYRPTERWRLGLQPPTERRASLPLWDGAGGDGGGGAAGGSGAIGAAKSLMTRMYGAISSRWLVADESRMMPVGSQVMQVGSRVMPIESRVMPAEDSGATGSAAALNGRRSSGAAADTMTPDRASSTAPLQQPAAVGSSTASEVPA